jgi:hypothetical protein
MAAGNVLYAWTAIDGRPPPADYAVLGVRNAQDVLSFADAALTYTWFRGVLPDDYGGGSLAADVYWTPASATTGVVRWRGNLQRQQEGGASVDSNVTGPDVAATGTANAAAGVKTKTSLTFTAPVGTNALLAGEPFRLIVVREGADAADTMAGAAELTEVKLREA